MDKLSNIKGIERGRAEFAYKCAEAGKISKKQSEYRSYVKSIPMMIKMNGVGSTLAFMFSKGGTYELIGQHILGWLKEDKIKILNLDNVYEFKELPHEVVKLDSETYRALTVEVLAFLSWLRRFAEGLIDSGE